MSCWFLFPLLAFRVAPLSVFIALWYYKYAPCQLFWFCFVCMVLWFHVHHCWVTGLNLTQDPMDSLHRLPTLRSNMPNSFPLTSLRALFVLVSTYARVPWVLLHANCKITLKKQVPYWSLSLPWPSHFVCLHYKSSCNQIEARQK